MSDLSLRICVVKKHMIIINCDLPFIVFSLSEPMEAFATADGATLGIVTTLPIGNRNGCPFNNTIPATEPE